MSVLIALAIRWFQEAKTGGTKVFSENWLQERDSDLRHPGLAKRPQQICALCPVKTAPPPIHTGI